ncbi:right-handed parallel beta-helix repeat-containing protein [Thalassobellus suaedae]|uniref:Right-handed parallel beta-helix repeat-containing protein n=1 Tax=Thalassobellus suaedae TaxID=3074124 RepID=A0ABY9XWA1_9FLAO|nr:right-handed parallel beta-helix repeat-containing protein [Flavobacteriaceae bacterium HL-DH14]
MVPGLIIVCGSINVTVDSVYLTDATGDAFIFGASNGFRYREQNKSYNKNVVLKNSVLNASRRNNISITDGEHLIVENCTIKNAGNGNNIYDSNDNKIVSSAGIAPKVGVDIEPFRGYDSNGNFINFEIVDDVIIRGCTFTSNNISSFINYSGKNVIFENNFSDHNVGASYDDGTKFLNNTLVASEKNRSTSGISLGTFILDVYGVPTQLSKYSQAIGNTIEGFEKGIQVKGDNSIVKDNVIKDFNYGIELKAANYALIENNTLESNKASSHGITHRGDSGKDIKFTNVNIKVPRTPIYFSNFNKTTSNTLIFDACTFESEQGYDVFFEDTDNVTIKNSLFTNTAIKQSNCINFIEYGNTYN